MANEPVRQHWVPKVYLRAFCSDPPEREQIHTRDLQTGKSFLASLDRVAVKRHFYTLSPGMENQSYAVENAHAQLESAVQPVLASTIADEALPGDAARMALLATFVATLQMRSRQGLQMIHGHREEIRAEVGSRSADAPARSTDNVASFDDELARELFAKSSVVVGKRIGGILLGMRWKLLRACDSYFLTSENPVISFNPNEDRWGLATPGTHTLFPLSPRLLIHISNETQIEGDGTRDAPPTAVHGLNGLILLGAEQYLFSDRPFDGVADLLAERVAGSRRAFGPWRPQ